MWRRSGYRCSTCGKRHEDSPAAWHFEAPASYIAASADERCRSHLSDDQCDLDGKRFFMKGLLRVPVLDADHSFEWGLWVEMDRKDFFDAHESWEMPGREDAPPRTVTMDNALPAPYGPALRRPALLRMQPVGTRPLIEIPYPDDPLAELQTKGITSDEIRTVTERLIHRGANDPLTGTRYEMDLERTLAHRPCPGCETEHPEVTGFIYRDGDPFAVFKAAMYAHGNEREVCLDVTLGTWADTDDHTDHVTFGCRFGRIDGHPDPACSMTTGGEHYPDAAIWGHKLTREEALQHEWAADFWSVVDYILLDDPDVSAFAARV